MDRLIPLIFDTRYIAMIGVLSLFVLTNESAALFNAIELAWDITQDHITH